MPRPESEAALGSRFGPRVGGFLQAARNLLRGETAEPIAISMNLVAEIGPALTLSADRDSLPVTAVETFIGQHVIGHIPGSKIPGQDETG